MKTIGLEEKDKNLSKFIKSVTPDLSQYALTQSLPKTVDAIVKDLSSYGETADVTKTIALSRNSIISSLSSMEETYTNYSSPKSLRLLQTSMSLLDDVKTNSENILGLHLEENVNYNVKLAESVCNLLNFITENPILVDFKESLVDVTMDYYHTTKDKMATVEDANANGDVYPSLLNMLSPDYTLRGCNSTSSKGILSKLYTEITEMQIYEELTLKELLNLDIKILKFQAGFILKTLEKVNG